EALADSVERLQEKFDTARRADNRRTYGRLLKTAQEKKRKFEEEEERKEADADAAAAAAVAVAAADSVIATGKRGSTTLPSLPSSEPLETLGGGQGGALAAAQ
ncbi:unnamed protein product, partial [Pylaiella littoralis]